MQILKVSQAFSKMYTFNIHTYRVQGREICPKMGAPTVFDEIEERKMHEFLLDAWFLRIPRTADQLSSDIKFMLDYEGKTTRFTHNRPGNNFQYSECCLKSERF